MTITHKTMAALLAVFLALLAGAAAVFDHAVRPQFEQLEATMHARNQARVAANLSALAEDVRARVTDYSNWDDTYAFVAGHNSSYTDDLSDPWFGEYGIDLVVFADNGGHIVWSKQRDGDGALAIRPDTARALLAQVQSQSGADKAPSGVVWVEGSGPIMLAASQVVHSDGSGPPRGWVIMGRQLSQHTLFEQTQLSAEFIDIAHAGPELGRQIERLGNDDCHSWTTSGALHSVRALRDLSGRLIGVVHTYQEREVMSLANASIGAALLTITGLFAIATAALWMLLRALIIRRVQRLERHLNSQGAAPAPLHQDGSGADRDEISRLTVAYNRLVERLTDAAQRERAAVSAREAAAAANRMKSDFLANISHELREPMDAIIGYAELVQEDLEDRGFAGARIDLERICEAARRQLTIVEEIFDLSKIEAGRLDLRCESFDVAEMVAAAAKLADPHAAALGTKLSVEVRGDLGVAYTDRRRLRQCLTNILTNACRLAEGGEVRLIARRERLASGDVLRFLIHDDGAPITAAQLARAFEPFAELDPALSKRLGGAGLGLTITRKVLTLLGGGLDAHSLGDAGRSFVLTAPALFEETLNGTQNQLAA